MSRLTEVFACIHGIKAVLTFGEKKWGELVQAKNLCFIITFLPNLYYDYLGERNVSNYNFICIF